MGYTALESLLMDVWNNDLKIVIKKTKSKKHIRMTIEKDGWQSYHVSTLDDVCEDGFDQAAKEKIEDLIRRLLMFIEDEEE